MKDAYEISFLKEFACQGGKCELTCCKNWIITVDDEALNEIKKEPLLKRMLYSLRIGKRSDGISYIKKINGRCPYLNRDNLCAHQCEGKMNLMPKICRVYPRRVMEICADTECRTEVTLELSCIEAANCFLNNLGPIQMIKSDENYEIMWSRKNDSDEFLRFLLDYRKVLSEDIWNSTDIFSMMKKHVYATLEIQDHLMKDFKVGGDAWVDTRAVFDKHQEKTLGFVIPLSILNEVIYNCFDDKDQKKRNPIFQKLRETYDSLLGHDREDVAERKIISYLLSKEYSNNALKKYFTYYEYCCYETVLETHEDYYLVGKVLFSVFYTELLMVFDYVSNMARNEGELAKELKRQNYSFESQVLSSVERAFRHSDKMKSVILEKIRANFLAYIFDSDML